MNRISCRICLNQENLQPLNLKQIIDNKYLTYSEIIENISLIKVSDDENSCMPQHICTVCAHNLVIAYSLKQQIIETDNLLKSLVEETQSQDIKIEEEDMIVFENYEFLDEKLENMEESQISCNICNILVSESKYRRHLLSHKQFPFLCTYPECLKRFSKEKNLARHINNNHKPTEPESLEIESIIELQCSSCERQFKNKDLLEAHEKRKVVGICAKEPSELSKKCYIPGCEKVFESITLKKQHIKQNHENFPRQCEQPGCNYKTSSSIVFEIHCKFHCTGFDYFCSDCGRSFLTRQNLKSHIETYHVQRTEKFECDLCGANLKFRQYIHKHMKTIHLKKKAYHCQYCEDKSFTSQSAMKLHLYNHHDEPAPIRCEHCNRPFTFTSELTHHLKRMNSEGKCSRFAGEIRKIANVESYCNLCQKKFGSVVCYQRHNSVHHNEKHKYKCEFCQKVFPIRSALTIHRRVHTKEKPYECFLCSKKFSDPATLYKHKRSAHSDSLVVACDVCTKSFFDSNEMIRHKKRVHCFKELKNK